mgnify:CR=1 FL=1
MNNLLKRTIPCIFPLFLNGCGNDDLDTNSIDAPNTYTFASQTDPSVNSSVDYSDATTSLILIKELEYLIGSDYLQEVGSTQGKQAAIDLLNKIYVDGTQYLSVTNIYDAQSILPTPIMGVTTSAEKKQVDFSSLGSAVKLQESLPGISADLFYRKENFASQGDFIGWSEPSLLDEDLLPDIMIQNWFGEIADLASDDDPDTKFIKSGINYQVLVGSFLLGATAYYQSTAYLINIDVGLAVSNTSEGTYTALQHNWDMAFGYFGANAHYKLFNKDQNSTEFEFDNDNDQEIDLLSEYNLGYSVDAATLDASSVLYDTNLSTNSVQAFLNGRKIINDHLNSSLAGNVDFKKAMLMQADTINTLWEHVIAAKLIHYLNLTAIDALHYGETDEINAYYAEHWGHAKGYALALQFNPSAIITLEELTDLHSFIGQAPSLKDDIYIKNEYSKKLVNAREKIRGIYDFSTVNALNW